MVTPTTDLTKRLARWMLPSEQPAALDIDHPAQEDIAAACDEIERLRTALKIARQWMPDHPIEPTAAADLQAVEETLGWR